MSYSIVTVDQSLLDLTAIDEDESDAVALAFLEFLLAETNAYYQQHHLARQTVHAVSSHLVGNIFDTVFTASLHADQQIVHERFAPEQIPRATLHDRHAVRCLPHRSPDKHNHRVDNAVYRSSPSRDSRIPNSVETSNASPSRTHGGVPLKRRRKPGMEKGSQSGALPQILNLSEEEDEKPEIKLWRTKCLKEMTTPKRRPTLLKWANVARAFTTTEIPMGLDLRMEADMIETPLLRDEALLRSLSSLSDIKMKSNIDSFSSIVDIQPGNPDEKTIGNRGEGKDIKMGIKSTRSSVTVRQTSSADSSSRREATTTKKKGVGVHLHDQLTRKPTKQSSVPTINVWDYDAVTDTGDISELFTPADSEFDATALPSAMTLASGVVLSQGEWFKEGPEIQESAHKMSRKRFDLHQRLATEVLLHTWKRDSISSLANSPEYVRQYEEVPPEPIPAPHLSPISTATLAIPRTHLSQSLSAPALRVRSSSASLKQSPSLSGGKVSPRIKLEAIARTREVQTHVRTKERPSTALATVMTTKNIRAGGSASSSKYHREFPTPQAGVIHIVNRDAVATTVDDTRQQLSWISS